MTSLTAQCRQVYCVVEMAPPVPSWRPRYQRGEFDGFPGRRERPSQYSHTTIVSGLFNIPNLQIKFRRSRRWRISPSDTALNQPSRQSPAACPESPLSSRTFTNHNNSLKREPNEWQNNEFKTHSPLESSIKASLKIMNWIASNQNEK